jgi:hypothetical protein
MLTLIADHRAAAIALLLKAAQDARHRGDRFWLGESPLNLLEATTLEMLTKRISIDASEGVQLDAIGELLNTPRGSSTDVAYRLRLKRQVAIDGGSRPRRRHHHAVSQHRPRLQRRHLPPRECASAVRGSSATHVRRRSAPVRRWCRAWLDNRRGPACLRLPESCSCSRDLLRAYQSGLRLVDVLASLLFRFDRSAAFDIDYCWSLAVRSSAPSTASE